MTGQAATPGKAAPVPDAYARWYRASEPDATDEQIAADWRIEPPGDREFWQALEAEAAGLRGQLASQHEAMTQMRADHREAMAALAARQGDPGPSVPRCSPLPTLRNRVREIADQLRKDADGIDADPYLSPLTRHADAEARRTAAARLDIAVAEDRAAAPLPVADAIRGALSALRRYAGATGPSRSARVHGAVADAERLILEALEGGGASA